MKNLLLCLTLLLYLCSYSQIKNLSWATQSGGGGIEQGFDIETDLIGNIYTVGYFQDTVDFDPSNGVHNLISDGIVSMFIQKLDRNGNFLWAITLSGNGPKNARDISIDVNGDLLITGYFRDTVDFDPGSGVFLLSSAWKGGGGVDCFILKLKADGSFIWAKSFGGRGMVEAYSLDSDYDGNVIITGRFSTTIDFDPDTSVYNVTTNGYLDIFILKLDSSGNFLWVTAMGSTVTSESGMCISTDSKGNVYTSGYFGPNTDFDPDTGVYIIPFSLGYDIFIQKLSPKGHLLWAKGISSRGHERAYKITTDIEDNLLLTGFFNDSVDFDLDTGTYKLTSLGVQDIFIQKLDSNGNLLWVKSIGSTGDDSGFALAVDDSNNIYTSGYFEGTVNFNTDSAGVYNLTSYGAEDIFIQKLDENGNFIWAESFGGSGDEKVRAIKLDQNGSILLTGDFEDTVDFNPDSNQVNNLFSNGYTDIFILKLYKCKDSMDSISLSACIRYLSPSGKVWTQSGVYLDTIPNSTGCDSLLSIDLTITSIDTSLTVVNHVKLTANDTLSSYQWIECTTGPIAGDTNRSFVATANGTYAVELTNNGCVDTSACISILSVGLDKSNLQAITIDFYPNPNHGVFTIAISSDLLAKGYQIYDVRGSLVQEAQFTSNQTLVDLSAFGKGVYFLHIREEGIRKKLVVY